MQRRTFLSRSAGAASLAIFAGSAQAAQKGASNATALPRRERVRVAFMLGEGSNVIDTAGPWEVFQDVMLGGSEGHHHIQPFELFTVGPADKTILTMTGGLRVQPQYNIENAPQPNVIVVPAQSATDEARGWLRKASAGTDVTMSVCTGSFQLARAGLLEGLTATTHHEYWDAFAKEFPNIELRRGLRFVDNGRIATAGGLTSGIDMALHIVARYFGVEVAAATAKYMEYSSEAWRTD
ncbi:DJ-1/PfpI family protein [Steroidobacter sp. S1-65]|uniref:DJ-1/PfpI family protein n=1 Tax=Steroidobacter gossypii TaxID=2805490 RepID=A0ABS1WW93_9GAMM|nr:DJ-1/PfpI family protein [Steroidobacter gossypii]MBM0105245.1 DJ-1/PfpI family protein [Steroidobacter gossypii]